MDASWARAPRRLAVLLGSLALLLVAGGDVAQAHYNQRPSGCTGVSGGITCFYLHGRDGTTHVDHFLQARDVFSLPQICNYKARFQVKQNGSAYYTKWSAFHQGCFYSWRATRSSGTVERNFRDPSVACGSWYEDGSRLGTACLNLRG